jgi:hypothetical protein
LQVTARAAVLALGCVAGCFGDEPADGALRCGRDVARPCPGGMYCASDGACWRSGHAPALPDASGAIDGSPTDDAAPTTDDGGGASSGMPCSPVVRCASGHCVDGVCCDSACDGQCQACDLEGQVGRCATVSTGPPHGTRPACTGGDTTCGGACTGASPTSCTYADTLIGCGAACDGVCDGAGHCSSSSTGSCPGGFACGIGGCKTSCSFDSDCQSRFRCNSGSCARISESDCLDGLDNNGDGLADCQDPTCSDRAVCVPAAPGGDTVGVLATDACPLNFNAPHPENQGLSAPACDGCSCRATQTCSVTAYFDTTSCTPGSTTVGLTTTKNSDGIGESIGCATVASLSPVSVEISTPSTGAGACTAIGTPYVPGKSWTLSRKFCGAERSSASCGTGQVCVAKPQPGAAICLRIPGDGATCPDGYKGGTVSTWYGDASDDRTCTGCDCGQPSQPGNCGTFTSAVATSTSAGCPLNVGDSSVNVGTCGTVMTPVTAIEWRFPGLSFPSCANLNYTSSGAATPVDPATICCPSCSCAHPPCISLACPTSKFCDGSACQSCSTPAFCGAACVDCSMVKADTCSGGTSCTCGNNPPCGAGADACVGGVCKCGSSPMCTSAQGTSCQGGACKCGSNPGCDGVLGICNGTSCSCGQGAACNPAVADNCTSGTCRCGNNFMCNAMTSDSCTSGTCKCGSGPACGGDKGVLGGGTSDRCVGGACKCGTGDPCATGHLCLAGMCL